MIARRQRRLQSEITAAARKMLQCAVTWCCLAFSLAQAETNVYQPVGAPADPKVQAAWNFYHDYAAATELLKQIAAAHPEICKLQSLGKSHEGRDLWLLTITNFKTGEDRNKSAFWIDGGIHANEIQSVDVSLYCAWFLTETYGRNEQITRLLSERVFYILPMFMPDSRDAHFHRANTVHTPRTGRIPRDDDGDGEFDEDPHNDLDRNGHITKMRIADPHGRSKPHPKYPHLMIDALPDEKGSYTILGDEGYDVDGDGERNEDGDGFYDPNRNFPWQWQPNYVDRGDRYPLSIIENRLVAEAILARPNIAGAQSFHNTGGMVTRGPGLKADEYDQEDRELFEAIASRGVKLLPGYKQLKSGDGLYEVRGSADDFFYFLNGTTAFVNELFTSYNYFHKPTENSYFGDPVERSDFNKYLLFGSGLVPWQKVLHPQFGEIEVGGWKKNWQRQPPSFMLEEECHRHMAFTLFHADQLPLVQVSAPSVKVLGNNLKEVTATVSNERMTPTRLSIDVKEKLTPPNTVQLSGPKCRVLAGLVGSSPVLDDLQEQKKNPEKLQIDTLGGMQARYVRWIVEGEGPFQVVFQSTKGGTAAIEIP